MLSHTSSISRLAGNTMQGVIKGSGSSTLLGCMTDSACLQVAAFVSPH